MATNYSFNVDSPFLQRTLPKPGDRTSNNPYGLSFGGGYSDAYTKMNDRFNLLVSADLKSLYSFLDDKSLDKLNPQNKQNSNPLSDSNSKEKNKFNLGKSLLNGVSSLGRGIGNFAINTGIWKDFNPEKGLFSEDEDEDGNKHFDFGQAIGNGLGNTGRLLGFASNFIPLQELANNKNNQMAQEVASTVGLAAMKSGNPVATLYGGALLMGLRFGINNQGSDTGDAVIDFTNSALSLVPGLGLLGKEAGTYHENAMVNASHSYGNIGDLARKNQGRFIVGGNKIKNSIEDANKKTVVADSILTDAKRDFTTDIGMIAQRINMGLTEGQDRVTNFGPAAAKQGAVLQFSKRTLSKNKIKKQQNGGIVVSYKPEGDIEINLERTPTFEEWVKLVPKEYQNELYDLQAYYEEAVKQADFGNPLLLKQLNAWLFAITRPTKEERDFYRDVQIPNELGELYNPYHLGSIIPLYDENGNETGEYMFVKLGTEENNPELHYETDEYKSGKNGLRDTHDLVFEGDRYYYRLKNPKKFKEGGKVNVIPDGALHKNKHHLEEVDEKFEDVTTKGIPVIVESEDGEVVQLAEVEREEIIFRLEVTKKLEELSKKHTDEAAIEAGKLLVKEILYNTEDNTGKMI